VRITHYLRLCFGIGSSVVKTLNHSKHLERLALLETELPREIRGQHHVISPVLSVARRGQLELTKPGRPRGSFLALGPTGVGKTELIIVFSRVLYGLEYLFRFDMSEFQTQDALGLLLGAKAGEIGMLGTVRKKAATGVLLFDEAEKAHPRILDILLQLLDAARLTTANGETLDFSGFYVWLTSNLGSAELLMLQHSSEATLERHVLTRAEQSLRPEIFARIDEKLVFHRLNYDQQLEVAEKFLKREIGFLRNQGHELAVNDGVLPLLVRKGFHPKLGMRPMRHAVEKLIGDAVAECLLGRREASGTLATDEARECLVVR
jgi:ATP-dependent Clp protease ATP-binding subunit ClpA